MTSDSPFDFRRIQSTAFGRSLDYHPQIDSTNDRAKRLAADPSCPMPLLVLAQQQTAGRGRGAHRWWSAEGSLTFSVVVGPEWLPHQRRLATLASLGAAVAVIDAVAPLVPSQPIGIHWPNDVAAGDRKLAGILIEVAAGRRHVIGIGVNTNNSFDGAPDEVRRRAGSLCELSGSTHDPTAVLVALLLALERRFAQLKQDPQAISRRANELCLQRGHDLCIAQGKRRTVGRCGGIADDGALILLTPDGQRMLSSGTICRD